MKRILLAPLLIASLLIADSALAGRPDPKKKLNTLKQEEYIATCNASGKKWSDVCNKIIKINRDRITNKSFIAFKKEYINKCCT